MVVLLFLKFSQGTEIVSLSLCSYVRIRLFQKRERFFTKNCISMFAIRFNIYIIEFNVIQVVTTGIVLQSTRR
jgi:hypothetical protein